MFLGSSYISSSVQTQLALFLWAILWGVAVALAYDGIRAVRRLWPPPKGIYMLEDILFWLITAFLIYRLLFRYDSGAVRSYTMLGMLVGMAVYLWFLGRFLAFVFKPFLWIFGKIQKFITAKLQSLIKFKLSAINMLKKVSKQGRMEDE